MTSHLSMVRKRECGDVWRITSISCESEVQTPDSHKHYKDFVVKPESAPLKFWTFAFKALHAILNIEHLYANKGNGPLY